MTLCVCLRTCARRYTLNRANKLCRCSLCTTLKVAYQKHAKQTKCFLYYHHTTLPPPVHVFVFENRLTVSCEFSCLNFEHSQHSTHTHTHTNTEAEERKEVVILTIAQNTYNLHSHHLPSANISAYLFTCLLFCTARSSGLGAFV